MLSYSFTTILILFGLAIAGGVAALINRILPLERRSAWNDSIASQLNVLGTTYAVILGFMMFNVWSEFRLASVGVTAEAAAVLELSRSADTLPPEVRSRARELTRAYAENVQSKEWTTMREQPSGRLPEDGDRILYQLAHIGAAHGTLSETSLPDAFRSALDHLHGERRLREERYRNEMPLGLWVLLLSGGVLVILSACLLGGHSATLHYVQVLSLSFLILVTLAAIADIDHPFAGSVTVGSAPFRDAVTLMNFELP